MRHTDRELETPKLPGARLTGRQLNKTLGGKGRTRIHLLPTKAYTGRDEEIKEK